MSSRGPRDSVSLINAIQEHLPNNVLHLSSERLEKLRQVDGCEFEASLDYRIQLESNTKQTNNSNIKNRFYLFSSHTALIHTDPYVKVSLLCDGRRLKKKKTTIKKNTLNPVYNEAIIFDIPPENMDQVSLLISVMDYDR